MTDDEKKSLLRGSGNSIDRVHYMENGSQAGQRISQSGSNYGVSQDAKPPGRRSTRLSNAFENSGVYSIALSWNDICVKVKVPGKRGFPFGESAPAYEKTILKNITGLAGPGCLLAIMGASGSGKSTLLNVLTSRNTRDYEITGECLLNGVPLAPGTIKNVSAYVQQSDLFIDTLTVREQLQFRALLRMDKKLDKSARLKRVEEVIQEMGLGGCSDSRIGAAVGTKKGISGGERKRLAFACEALANPPIFFADEPTSSLDSFMAQNIVTMLQKMAARGRCILCTIHQPSSELFAMFNQVLILSEGRVAYMGTSADCLDFYRDQGYPCPDNFNPSDHYILTMAIVPGKEEECKKRGKAICDSFDRSGKAAEIKAEIESHKKEVDMYDHVVLDQVTGESRYVSSRTTQWQNLFWRSWVTQFRNSMLFGVRIGQIIGMSLIIGLVYLDLDVDQKGIMNINGAIFMMVANGSMANMFAVLTSFPEETLIVMREYGSGLYKVTIYFVAKVVSEIPMYLFTTLIFVTMNYWMIGLANSFDCFLTAYWVILLSNTISVAFGYVASILSGDTTVALSIAPLVLVPLMLFGGVLMNGDSTPVYFKPLAWVSWYKYAYELLMINQWDNYDFIPCPNVTLPLNATIPQICAAMNCPYRSGQAVLEYNSMSSDDELENTMILLGILAGMFLISLIAIIVKARNSRE